MKVLFVCTANSCRSQMAEAWARHLFPADWEVYSAGLVTYRITSDTRQAMAEAGLDMAGQKSKTFDRYDLDDFDLVVTLSPEAGTFLPDRVPPERHAHHPLEDPMGVVGSEEEVSEAFRRTSLEVRDIVEKVVSGEIGASLAG